VTVIVDTIRQVPIEISKELAKWLRNSRLLRGAHLSLGTAAIVLSVLVASQIRSLDPVVVSLLAAGSAIATGLLTGFDLGTKANQVRNAWRLLNSAVIEFQENPNYPVETLIATYSHGEQMIGDVRAEPNAPS
jgi:hypothetical protein